MKQGSSKPLQEDIKMMEAIELYHRKIGHDLITEPSTYTTSEWISMLNECIEKNITIWELWGEEYKSDELY